MHVLDTCKYKKDRIKKQPRKDGHRFPHYKSMGAFCCHGNQSIDPIFPKTLHNLSLTPVMLHKKFDQIGQLALEIFKLESVADDDGRRATTDGRTTDHWYTISSPCGSGELKTDVHVKN